MRIRFDISELVWLEAEPRHFNNTLVEESFWNEFISQKGFEWAKDKGVKFIVYRKTDSSEYEIGHFFLSAMPGCCGVCISHNAYLNERTRHSGLSNPFRDIKPFIARLVGYSSMIATSIVTDIPAFKSMLKSNYRIVDTFTNNRTNNVLAFGFKKL